MYNFETMHNMTSPAKYGNFSKKLLCRFPLYCLQIGEKKKKKNLRASNIQGPKALKQEREGEQPAKLYCLYSHKGHQFPTKIILQLNQNN